MQEEVTLTMILDFLKRFHQEFVELKAEVGGLSGEVGGLKAEVGGLKEQFKEFKENFRDFKSDVNRRFSEQDKRFDRLEDSGAELKTLILRDQEKLQQVFEARNTVKMQFTRAWGIASLVMGAIGGGITLAVFRTIG